MRHRKSEATSPTSAGNTLIWPSECLFADGSPPAGELELVQFPGGVGGVVSLSYVTSSVAQSYPAKEMQILVSQRRAWGFRMEHATMIFFLFVWMSKCR